MVVMMNLMGIMTVLAKGWHGSCRVRRGKPAVRVGRSQLGAGSSGDGRTWGFGGRICVRKVKDGTDLERGEGSLAVG